MANRLFNQFQGTLQKGVVTLFAKVTFDGDRVPTLVTEEVINADTSPVTINPSNGFAKVEVDEVPGGQDGVRLTLQDPYVRLLGVSMVGVLTEGSPPPGNIVTVVEDGVSDDDAPSLLLALLKPTYNPAPSVVYTAVVPASCTVLFSVTLANSTAL